MLAIVEVDPEIGRVHIEKYVVAHDCGVVVNPMLVEGQIMGGAAQGLGGILCEEHRLRCERATARRLADGLHAADRERHPGMQIIHQHSPSPLNPLGVKGVGEGGAVCPARRNRQCGVRCAAAAAGRAQPVAAQACADQRGDRGSVTQLGPLHTRIVCRRE